MLTDQDEVPGAASGATRRRPSRPVEKKPIPSLSSGQSSPERKGDGAEAMMVPATPHFATWRTGNEHVVGDRPISSTPLLQGPTFESYCLQQCQTNAACECTVRRRMGQLVELPRTFGSVGRSENQR